MKIRFCEAERRVFARREKLTVSQWAGKYLIVQDGIYRGSPLRLDVSPFLRGPMDAYSRPGVREVVVCGSLQVGKTLLLYACLGWSMDYRPGIKMLAMPTRESRDRVVEKKLRPMLQGSPVLRRMVAKYRRENILLKDGTSIELATAESPSQRASITVQDLFVDEEDLYSRSGDSSPLEDFKGRTRSYGDFAKIIRACQPKGDESSSIWTGITRQVDQLMCYEVVCPACRHQHLMDVDRIVVPDGETDPRLIRSRKLARYRCPHCRYLWSDHARDLAVASGHWRPYVWTGAAFEPGPDVRDARSIGFHLPAVLSRFVSLSDLAARRILAGSDDPAQQRQYHNDDLGMPWSPVELQTDVDRLLELRDPHLPPRTVPHGAVALTCGIDVQKRGFWYLVRAWMPTMASYVIDYGYLGSWDDVQALVFDTCYPVQGPDGSDVGERMPIWRACIDSGGTETEGVYTRTEEVYMWVRANGCGVVHACKGASRPQAAPVRWVVRERMPHNGRPIPGGLRLYLIDSGAFKTTDMGRMLNQDSRQPLRFHAGADETLASQLSAERMVRKNGNLVWVRERKDNHLLDCLVLSAAAADASWTPSLPHYILQLQAQARMQSETPRPRAKKRPQPEAAGHRW